MTPEQLAQTVGTMILSECDKVRAELAGIIGQHTRQLGDIELMLQELAVNAEPSEEAREAYRLQVVTEAARLGVTAGELTRFRKAIEPFPKAET